MHLRFLLVLPAAAALSACGSEPAKQPEPGVSPAPGPVEAAVPADNAAAVATAATPAVFAPCAVCHGTAKGGKALVGPDLWGVVGSAAASRPGFAYSDQLKAAGLTWDEATLDRWLADPAKLVPGTRMVFPGQPDAAKRKALIAFLETLR